MALKEPRWVSAIIIKIDRKLLRRPRTSLARRLWQTFREWYSWRCDICGKRSGPMQMTNASLRCEAHRLEAAA